MPSLLKFERAKFGVLHVETAAARKEVPNSTLEEAWTSLEVTKTVPAKSLVEVKAVFKDLYSDYFEKEGTPVQGNQIYAWDAWNLLVRWNEILQQVKEMANREIEALRAQEEKALKSWLVGRMTIKCYPRKPHPWRQSSSKLCPRKAWIRHSSVSWALVGPLPAFSLNYEQACAAACSLLHFGTVAMHSIPGLCPGYTSKDLYSFLLDFCLPPHIDGIHGYDWCVGQPIHPTCPSSPQTCLEIPELTARCCSLRRLK
ncbi:hypothetical protein DSO57_1025445 [Entomophthora muscae]|uniref:Uncharacterized protein n=1 Tax=Entomophthora muscae TaxID=34485 RepID=A0ACC2TDH9_9FUNG|nr:hypothetical protein DSO57_1025445 [Entomophthora muscae]